MIEPLYKHDCDDCIFLGIEDDVDMYYHMTKPGTVIARRSDVGSDYTSGWDDEVVILDPYLSRAKKLALQR